MKIYDINGNEVITDNSSNVIVGEKLIDTSVVVNTGYSGALWEQYGSNVNIFGDYIDVSENKSLYYKMPVFNQTQTCLMGFGCYDAEKNFLYYSKNNESVKNICFVIVGWRFFMYADKISEAMDKSIKETNRRRTIQNEYNVKNNIEEISKKYFL